MERKKGTAAYKYRKRKFFAPAYQHGKIKNKGEEHFKRGDVGLLKRDNGEIYVAELETPEQVSQASTIWQEIRNETARDLNGQTFGPKGYTEPTMRELDKKLAAGGSLAREISKKTGVRIQ